MHAILVASDLSTPDPEEAAAILMAAIGYLGSLGALTQGWRHSDAVNEAVRKDPFLGGSPIAKSRQKSSRGKYGNRWNDGEDDNLADILHREDEIDEATTRAIRYNLHSIRRLTILSDLMLVLMVLGVVGAAFCAIFAMWIATPIVAGVAPTAWIASNRLNTASKRRQEELKDLQRHRHENKRETVTLERSKLELAIEGNEQRLRALRKEVDDASGERYLAERRLAQVNIRKYELEKELRQSQTEQHGQDTAQDEFEPTAGTDNEPETTAGDSNGHTQ